MRFSSKVLSCGHYLPEKIVSNFDLESMLDTTSEWIVQRTGIENRHIANDQETTAYMAYKAAQEALKNANFEAQNVDMIVLATSTPDHPFPATATKVQSLLKAHKSFCV